MEGKVWISLSRLEDEGPSREASEVPNKVVLSLYPVSPMQHRSLRSANDRLHE